MTARAAQPLDLRNCRCALRVIARCARLSQDADIVDIACETLEDLGLSPEERMAAEDPCPVHPKPHSLVALCTFGGLYDAACVRRGERPHSEVLAEQIAAGAQPYQMQAAGRA